VHIHERHENRSFVRWTVGRLAEVERRSQDGTCGIRRSDKYDDGVPVERKLCVGAASLYPICQFMVTTSMPGMAGDYLPGGICPSCFFQMTVTSGSAFDWQRNSTSDASWTVTSFGPSMIRGRSEHTGYQSVKFGVILQWSLANKDKLHRKKWSEPSYCQISSTL